MTRRDSGYWRGASIIKERRIIKQQPEKCQGIDRRRKACMPDPPFPVLWRGATNCPVCHTYSCPDFHLPHFFLPDSFICHTFSCLCFSVVVATMPICIGHTLHLLVFSRADLCQVPQLTSQEGRGTRCPLSSLFPLFKLALYLLI